MSARRAFRPRGRGFTAADDKAGAEKVAIISYRVWQNRYAKAQDVAGRVVRLNGQPTTIVGVMPEGFQFPSGQEIWTPLVPNEELQKRSNRSLQLFDVVRPGMSAAQADADLAVIAKRLAASFAETNKDLGVSVQTFHEAFNGGNIRTVFLLMLGAVGFVPLIACANVANMMLSRALCRRRENSVRAAMGASRWQLIRQLLIESVVLSVLGGLLGLALILTGVHYFDLATLEVRFYWIAFGMDYMVFGYFAAISVLSGLAFGLVLMVRSFFAAQTVNEFVPAAQIFTARIGLPEGKGERYAERGDRLRFYDELLRRLTALPGVTHVAVMSSLPGSGSGNRRIEIEGRPTAEVSKAPLAAVVAQWPGYLAAIGLGLEAGRSFEVEDGNPGREAAVATREFAARHWPNQSAVGKRFRFFGDGDKPGPWIQVVGVSADLLQSPQNADAHPLVFIPHRQEGWGGMALLVRTRAAVAPSTLARPVQSLVQELDQDLPVYEVSTLPETLGRQRWGLVVFGALFFSFACIGLLIASVGIYAVVAQAASRRTREVGIRMALGATANSILGIILLRGVKQLGAGLVLGLAGALAATRLMKDVLMRVSPQDPVVFVAVASLLILIGLFACWLPARRAAALHPVQALREE